MVYWETNWLNPNDTPLITTTVESVFQAAWPLPLWIAIVFSTGAFALVSWLYWTERGTAHRPIRVLLASIRCILFLTALWMLAGWSVLRFETEQPELAIVVDNSASMATQDASSATSNETHSPLSRFEKSQEIIQSISPAARQNLLDNYQVRCYTMAERLEPASSFLAPAGLRDVATDGPQSRLGDSMQQLIERQIGRGTAAIVFFSDGINTAGGSLDDAAKLARASAIPIYTILTGREFALPDLRLADLLLDREVYLGDRVSLEVAVIGGDIPDHTAKVTLSDASTGNVLDQAQVPLTQAKNQQAVGLSFVPERPGEIALRIDLSTVEGETELANNILTTSVNVQDKTIRVLLVNEKPSYEFRFLKNLLERSKQSGASNTASFELQSVLQESDVDYINQDQSALRLVPSSSQLISQFDVFVFGEFDPNLVSRRSQQVIYEAVTEAGAGCIFVYGSGSPANELEGWPLGDLLPVQTRDPDLPITRRQNGSFQWQLTSLGTTALPLQLAATTSESQSIWKRLPRFHSVCEVGPTKAGAQVLAIASDVTASGDRSEFPLLITQYAGAGRVALQATDETYLLSSFEGSDLYHQRYWGQMVRWLSRGRLEKNLESSELIVEPSKAKFGQTVRFEARLGKEISESNLPESVQVLIESDASKSQTLILLPTTEQNRVYEISDNRIAPGNYRALLVQPVTTRPPSQEFMITTPPGEQANLRANARGMRDLAVRSRGRSYTEANADRLFEDLPRGKPTRLGTLPPLPIWNSHWVAIFFVLLITTEWLIRRSFRML